MKKVFIVTLLITFGLFITQVAYADDKPICFKPMIAIPGFNNTGCDSGQIAISSKGDAIASYIYALYDYAAGAAGVVAMFMIVFAAWQWIIAAGNASKIDTAKDTIRGALLGLAFLFTGHLLLSNISVGLVDFNSLELEGLKTIQMNVASAPCSTANATEVPVSELVCGQSACVLDGDGVAVILGNFCSGSDFCLYKQSEDGILGGCNSQSGFCYSLCPGKRSEMIGALSECECVSEGDVRGNQPPL